MRVVITGAGGFLGNSLLRELAELDEHQIVAATSRPDELRATLDAGNSVIVDSTDLLESGTLTSEDLVINCAFPRSSDGFNLSSGLDYLSSLVSRAARNKVAGFINISSQSLYDQHRLRPARETDRLCLQSSYAVAKRAVELLVETKMPDVPFSNIRLASQLGPGFNQRIPNRMIERALETGTIQVFENDSRFGFMDVRDTTSALCMMVGRFMEDVNEVYNLSSDLSWSLGQIAGDVKRALEEIHGEEIIIEYHRSQEKPVNTLVNSDLFRSAFDWEPFYSRYDTVLSIASAFGA